MKIETSYQSTPALWQAITDEYDGAEDAGPQLVGWGPSERAAIEDLVENVVEAELEKVHEAWATEHAEWEKEMAELKAGGARVVARHGWIPVGERLPEIGEWAIIYRVGGINKHRDVLPAFRRHRPFSPPDVWEWLDMSDGGWGLSVDGSEVTHWMPRPYPPDTVLNEERRPDEYMCPNCVTPWKCNGPHITESESEPKMTRPPNAGCIGGPCVKRDTPCNGPTGTASCGECNADGWTLHPASVVRVAQSVAFIECRGQSFAFTFGKIDGYRGEYPKELGLREGSTVYAAVVDGKVVRVHLPKSEVPPEEHRP